MVSDRTTEFPGNKGVRRKRASRTGTVVSDKGDKTIRVRFDYTVRHQKYGKYFRRSTILATHDEKNEAKEGDLVEVAACRRMSKTKAWRLVRVLRPAEPKDSADATILKAGGIP